MSVDSQRLNPIESERARMLVDAAPAVFKTVGRRTRVLISMWAQP
jgi:hypothetical protein